MASDKDKTIPNLSNATPGFLVDRIGEMRVEAARLKFLDGIYKQALNARITSAQKSGAIIEGERYNGDIVSKKQDRISPDKVREELKNEPERLARCVETIEFEQLNTKPRVNQF